MTEFGAEHRNLNSFYFALAAYMHFDLLVLLQEGRSCDQENWGC